MEQLVQWFFVLSDGAVVSEIQQIRHHGAYDHMPSGADPEPWLGTYPRGAATDPIGVHMIGTVANMPPATAGTQSGADGAASGTAFTAASGQFTAVNTGDTILITDTGASSAPFVYSFTVTYVDATSLTLDSSWAGVASSGLPWVLSGSAPSNAGLTYYATDGTDSPTGSLYQSDGTQWIPIASATSTVLPPWFDCEPFFLFDPSAGGGDTFPSIDIIFARLMVQTVSGEQYPTSYPVGDGTVLGDVLFTVTDPGSVKSGGNSNGTLFFYVTSHPDVYFPKTQSDKYVIGSGEILQYATGTTFTFALLSSGEMRIGGIPDLFPPSSPFANLFRIGNANLMPPTVGWPWTLAAGDVVSASWQYSMGID